ncbi:hypothetical protein [Frigidibacter sp.]|uniref:hypothetical protein n=1 Tax=Frigidibacter sp. TaxID=2586418 RepID=UPI0027333638|nr:hypothetical protein [Frigidibacter sp.]MDP3339770.1 hypothetical protein [Frigidibacter sp.]
MIIVASSDDNYVAGAMVLFASVARHNPEARFVLLDMGISAANLGRLEALAAHLGRPLQVIDAA